MRKNMGIADRFIRILISVAIGILYFTNDLHGVIGYVFLGIACILFATAVIGICPLYKVLDIDTGSKHKNV